MSERPLAKTPRTAWRKTTARLALDDGSWMRVEAYTHPDLRRALAVTRAPNSRAWRITHLRSGLALAPKDLPIAFVADWEWSRTTAQRLARAVAPLMDWRRSAATIRRDWRRRRKVRDVLRVMSRAVPASDPPGGRAMSGRQPRSAA